LSYIEKKLDYGRFVLRNISHKNKNLKQLAYNELVDYLKSNGLADITTKEVYTKLLKCLEYKTSGVWWEKKEGNLRHLKEVEMAEMMYISPHYGKKLIILYVIN